VTSSDVLDGGIVAAVGFTGGLIEIVGRNPLDARIAITVKPAQLYLLLNVLFALGAFGLAVIFQLHFRSPDRLWRIVACGLTGLAALRGLPGLARPVRSLLALQQGALDGLSTAVSVKHSDQNKALSDQLIWVEDKEAICLICQLLASNDARVGEKALAARVARCESTGLTDELRMWSLMNELDQLFGRQVLASAVAKLLGTKSSPVPAAVIAAREPDRE
jgi:hypothetical protein